MKERDPGAVYALRRSGTQTDRTILQIVSLDEEAHLPYLYASLHYIH